MTFDLDKALRDKRARTIEGRLVVDLQMINAVEGDLNKMLLVGKSHCYRAFEPDNEKHCVDWTIWECGGRRFRFPSDLDLTTDE